MLRRMRQALSAALPLLPERTVRRLLRRIHPFDLRHGTDTGGLLYAPELMSGHPHDRFNEGYYATAPSVFRGLVERWQNFLPGAGSAGLAWPEAWAGKLSDYSFLDLGCGKGRVLLLASELPFRAIAGVELNPALCAVARRNLQRWLRRPRACPRIHIHCGDVLDAPLPDGPLLLFLFNSFEAEVVRLLLERLIKLTAGRSAPIDLLYVHPDHAALVERTPGVTVLFDGEVPFTREDRLADVFGVGVDRCGMYRIGVAERKAREETPR